MLHKKYEHILLSHSFSYAILGKVPYDPSSKLNKKSTIYVLFSFSILLAQKVYLQVIPNLKTT
ncbi:hypothetical protein COK00_00070 [Bacillus cereus]|nr:hypothetical protein CN468_29265 [Bacillus cereus]PEX38143.1 hypothetical protein CN455_13880 [Bacillus cereus]PFB61740.1 hypothetical protein CN291_22690 [Bacillus cereus]PFP69041.1 hypothetical protein COK00_00070 [Bacillus cereus]PFR19539.1 hypothetical protein COK23_15875 [Bacillus cereus]